MGFFDDLGDALSTSIKDQFGLAENKPGDLDSSIGPIKVPYGKLGDFANEIDKSAHRRYIESGAIRNLRPRAMEVISQQPDITILVKKRLFSSLQENYKLNLLDEEEALFIRATKALFERKCQALAAYERLTKFQNITSKNDGIINDYALPSILGSFETLESFGINFSGQTKSTVETLKKIKAFSDPAPFTTWLNDQTIPFASPQGPGTGVIEFTNVSNVSTKTSVEFGEGSASLTFEDPYKIMLVTDEDIEDAINEATNLFSQNNFFRVTESQLQSSINTMKQELNRIRRNSGASEIRFVISEETILSKKVRAIIDEEGREIKFRFDAGSFGLDIFAFNPDTVFLFPSATQGQNGLQGPEIDLFKRIVNDIFILASLRQTTRSEIRQYNEQTNAVRRKMRLHYGSKPIIQPMDVVYVFVSSKTINDPLISKGLKRNFGGANLLNRIDDTIENIEATLDNIQNTFSGGTAAASHLENEKNAIAGVDFPMWLWNLMKTEFTRQSAGTCVFAGIVKGTSHEYSGGKYTLNVSANDNAHYFNKGSININPSVDVFNSALYDPLTPFKVNFDTSSGILRGEVPELLDANIRLLNSGSIRAKTGRWKGTPVDEEQFIKKTDVEHVASGLSNYTGNTGRDFRIKFSDPDGFVYKWKEGIGSLVLFGEPYGRLAGLGSFASEASPRITNDPFAGQDTMNVMSLLITGEPYNYNTFVRGAFESGSFNKEDLFNEVISNSFYKGLISDITRNNSIWGNFVPFKNLVVNEREYSFLTTGEFDMINRNRTLSDLVRRRAEVFDELASASAGVKDTAQFYQIGTGGDVGAVANVNVGGIEALGAELNELDSKINALQKDFEQHLQSKDIQSPQGTLQIIGDDISFDPTITGADGDNTEAKRREQRAQLRKDTNYLSLRRLWAVKGNEDRNFFIVDDTYDKNFDIQQFERSLNGQMEKFKSNYVNSFDQIKTIKEILGLEVFADSQGHIRARPPQYNRMPSSVFREMLQTRAEKGIKVFPEYLESLFFNTIQGIAEQLEIVEDQIRLRAAALGRTTDSDVQKLLGGGVGAKGNTFRFLTKPNDGKFGGLDIRSLLRQNAPDLDESTASKALTALNTAITAPLNATINFDIVKRIEVASEQISFTTNASNIQNRIDTVSARLKERTRDPNIPSSVQDIFSYSRVISLGTRRQSDVLKVTDEIAQYVAERQRLLKTLAPAVANLREGLSVNNLNSNSAQGLLTPNLKQKPDTIYPELLESLIEDEDNHDLGPGSGKRFILTDAKIISFTLMENEPEYNSIQVDGRLGQGLVNFPQGLETGNGGNAIGSAWATDYDLWQMYGLRQGNPVNAPFFQDPNGQCAPYAVFLLNLQRQQIFTAQATVVGNEFIQPGEVYYIEDYNLLFYAKSVSQNFTYNGQFVTSLELTFGHIPGAYIPTQLDVIGKGLYSHRHQANLLRHVRHNRADDSRALSVVVRDSNSAIFEGQFNNVKALVEGTFGEQNRKNLGNVMLATTGLLTPTTQGRTLNIELRTYYNSDRNINENSKISQLAESVKSWIVDPRKVSLDGSSLLPDGNNRPTIDPSRVNVVAIDLSPKIKSEVSPSSQAWTMARTIAGASNLSNVETITAFAEQQAQEGNAAAAEAASDSAIAALANREVQALAENIIDIWITFEDPDQITEET